MTHLSGVGLLLLHVLGGVGGHHGSRVLDDFSIFEDDLSLNSGFDLFRCCQFRLFLCDHFLWRGGDGDIVLIVRITEIILQSAYFEGS